MQGKYSDGERSAGLPGNPEIHEISGVGCPPLTNLSRRQHRCVRVLRAHTHTLTSALPDCVSELHSSLFTTFTSSFQFFFLHLLSVFLHSHSDFPIRFLFLQLSFPLSSGWLLTFNVLSPGSFKELGGQLCVTLA